MRYQFSGFENFLAFGPMFAAGAAAALLASLLGWVKKGSSFSKTALFYVPATIVFFAAVVMSLYLKGAGEQVAGAYITKAAALVLAAVLGLFLMTAAPSGNDSAVYILYLFFAAGLYTAMTAGTAVEIFAAFTVLDTALAAGMFISPGGGALFNGMLKKKVVYFFICLLFLAAPARGAGTAGVIIFMVLMSNTGLLTMERGAGGEREQFLNRNMPALLLGMAGLSAAAARLINIGGVSAYSVILASAVMTALNTYKAITEENYGIFAMQDSANICYLIPAALCATAYGFAAVVPALLLAALSAVCLQDFLAPHDARKYTVARVKYGFDRMKTGGLALFGLAAGLAAEVYIIYLFYTGVKQDPAVLAAVMFLAMIYAVGALNKIFMIFSMASRIRVDSWFKLVFNKHTARPAIYAAFAALLVISGLK